ncbi:MAG: methyl-accepting chemotaxis protein, partial [Oceanobacter sp.]
TTEVIGHLYELESLSQQFIATTQGFNELKEAHEHVSEQVASNESLKALSSTLSVIKTELNGIQKNFQANDAIEKELIELTTASAGASNNFIRVMSQKLADSRDRFSVSDLERATISGALNNTLGNMNIRILFDESKTDPAKAKALEGYLNELLANVERDIRALKGTPMVEGAVKGREVNLRIKEILTAYMANSADIATSQEAIDKDMHELLSLTETLQNSTTEEAFSNLSSDLVSIILVIAVAIVATVSASIALGRSVVKPLAELGRHVERLASSGGDLTYRIQLHRSDELGCLAKGINRFLESLQTIFSGIKQTGQEITSSAQQAADNSTRAADLSDRQRKDTADVAVAIGQMESAIDEVARNASSAAESVRHADSRSTEVVGTINAAVESINRVSDELASASSVIQQLNDDSQNIGSILDVIRSIADQTNLLALNAAIEAARAGEQGRGFAVVADEVRSLAQRTQSSIEEIHTMISKLQDASGRAALVISSSADQITSTVTASQQAGDGVKDISGLVSGISEMNIQMASAVEEQSTVVREINKLVRQIEGMAEDSNRAATQANDSSATQTRAAQRLQDLTSQFQV